MSGGVVHDGDDGELVGNPLLLDGAPPTPVMANTFPTPYGPEPEAPFSPPVPGHAGLVNDLLQVVPGASVPPLHAHTVRLLFRGLS